MIAICLMTVVHAYESDEVPLDLWDQTDLFTEIEMGTGWLPSGSDVQFGVFLRATGGGEVEMEGLSQLTWPTALTLNYGANPGTGLFTLDNELELSFDLKWDLDLGFSGEESLGGRSIGFEGKQRFTPWGLTGSEDDVVEVVAEGEYAEVFAWQYDVIANLVSIYFYAEVYPRATASFDGLRFNVNDQIIEYEGLNQYVDVPDDGEYVGETTFTGLYEAVLSLIIQPSFGVCIDILDCREVLTFEVPLDVVESSVEKDFAPESIRHPLPWLRVPSDGFDYGSVEVGQIATWEVLVENLGEMELTGSTRIEGSEDFTAFPGQLYAGPQNVDGMTVTFAPSVVGGQIAELILTTNDPARPEIAIPLIGNGYEEGGEGGGDDTGLATDPDGGIDVDPDDANDTTTIPAEVGCNCSQPGGQGSAPVAWLAGLGLLGLIRRRR